MPRRRADTPRRGGFKQRQEVNVAQARGFIDTRSMSAKDQARFFQAGSSQPANEDAPGTLTVVAKDDARGLAFLRRLAEHKGDLIDILDPGEAARMGIAAEREWRLDQGTNESWRETTERGLFLASQEREDDDAEAGNFGPWEGASDVHYPILTTAALQFQARAYPELVKGDKAVGVKTFDPPPSQPSAAQLGKAQMAPIAQAAQQAAPQPPQGAPAPQMNGAAPPPPQLQQAAQGVQQQVQQGQQVETEEDLAAKARQSRANRVGHFMNWIIFYEMDDWEGETDLLLLEMPISGVGFKKVFMRPDGLQSDYVSALRLTVNNDTKSMQRCPRITQDFDIYPNEIASGQRAGRYQTIELGALGEDPEEPRLWIEQHRVEDLDGDGLPEPYIVTVDVETKQTMRIEAAFTAEDITINEIEERALRIERWQPFPAFRFLPDPRGHFYGLGLARLLESVTDSVDTAINQLIDAGNAEIAGGGFIGSGVRLQGPGQGGSVWFRPGEYQTVSTPGPNLQEAIWERTVPHPSNVTMQMLELLLAAAKDISSVKDVITGDAPSTAPVGTTMALQNQALQVFSSIYKRIYRGFRDEYRLMYHCLKRYGEAVYAVKYKELTGGDFTADFAGDGTDIQPVADPSVVTKMQKISKMQTLMQLAESPVGMAAEIEQPGPAQALIEDALDVLDVDRPERFLAPVPPNPELLAKVQELSARAEERPGPAHGRQIHPRQRHGRPRSGRDGGPHQGKVGLQTHAIHQEADRVAKQGLQPPPDPEGNAGNGSSPSLSRPRLNMTVPPRFANGGHA